MQSNGVVLDRFDAEMDLSTATMTKNRVPTSDLFLLPVFLVLGIVGFGWVFFPALGMAVTLLSITAWLLLISVALVYRSRSTKATEHVK